MPSLLPLDDLVVIDLSHALAGPFASTMLADYGANVIKIEPPGSGDIARGWGPPFYETTQGKGLPDSAGQRDGGEEPAAPKLGAMGSERRREGSYFVGLHRNKKSVELDLK